ncbi:MAG: endopeptidase La, partial [Clostridia bacterium]|nr:endopeptidase La [Clostridia bacterium]
PSAGIAIATAMLSALTGRAVKAGIAMTGEITLRGRVLTIGGLKEKTMAAKRNGIHTVILPKNNTADLEEIDPVVREEVIFTPVSKVSEVLDIALVKPSALPLPNSELPKPEESVPAVVTGTGEPTYTAL